MPKLDLQHELKKKRPFTSPAEEAVLSLLRTSDQLNIRLSRLFRAHRLTSSQYNILRILRGEGAPLPILEIASRTIAVVPGITGLIDRLERAGHVRRTRCREDRRVVYIALTEKAEKLLATIDAPLDELHRSLLSALSPAQLKQLTGLLARLRRQPCPGRFLGPPGVLRGRVSPAPRAGIALGGRQRAIPAQLVDM